VPVLGIVVGVLGFTGVASLLVAAPLAAQGFASAPDSLIVLDLPADDAPAGPGWIIPKPGIEPRVSAVVRGRRRYEYNDTLELDGMRLEKNTTTGAVIGGIAGALFLQYVACGISDTDCDVHVGALALGGFVGALLGAGIASTF